MTFPALPLILRQILRHRAYLSVGVLSPVLLLVLLLLRRGGIWTVGRCLSTVPCNDRHRRRRSRDRVPGRVKRPLRFVAAAWPPYMAQRATAAAATVDDAAADCDDKDDAGGGGGDGGGRQTSVGFWRCRFSGFTPDVGAAYPH